MPDITRILGMQNKIDRIIYLSQLRDKYCKIEIIYLLSKSYQRSLNFMPRGKNSARQRLEARLRRGNVSTTENREECFLCKDKWENFCFVMKIKSLQ